MPDNTSTTSQSNALATLTGLTPEQLAALTPAEKQAAMQSAYARLSGNAPQAHSATAPPDQKVIAFFDDNNKLMFAKNENYDPNAVKTTVYGNSDSGFFRLDNDGNPVVVMNPNPDTLVDKAITRQGKEHDIRQREANEAAGKGYGTDEELQKRDIDLRRQNLDEEKQKEAKRQFDIKQKNQDALDKASIASTEQSIKESAAKTGLYGAQTGETQARTGLTGAETIRTGAETLRTGAETGKIGAETKRITDLTPAEIEEAKQRGVLAGSQAEYYKQQAEDLKRKAGLPSIVDLGAGATYATMGPKGEITEQMRQGYLPKTLPEVQARVGQLQAAMQAKSNELAGKISDTYTAEQANKDYTTWYDQNVAPAQGALQTAQEQALYDRAKEEAATRQASFTAAEAAGRNVVSAYQAQAPYMVGPRAAEVASQAAKTGSLEGVDFSNAAFYKLPDLQKMQQQAVADALKYISPTAAAQAGVPPPNYAGMDIAGALNRTRWTPQALPPQQQNPSVTIKVEGQGDQGQQTPPPNLTANDIANQFAATGGQFAYGGASPPPPAPPPTGAAAGGGGWTGMPPDWMDQLRKGTLGAGGGGQYDASQYQFPTAA